MLAKEKQTHDYGKMSAMTLTYKGESITLNMPGWYCNQSDESRFKPFAKSRIVTAAGGDDEKHEAVARGENKGVTESTRTFAGQVFRADWR